jgi:hypothetical protein
MSSRAYGVCRVHRHCYPRSQTCDRHGVARSAAARGACTPEPSDARLEHKLTMRRSFRRNGSVRGAPELARCLAFPVVAVLPTPIASSTQHGLRQLDVDVLEEAVLRSRRHRRPDPAAHSTRHRGSASPVAPEAGPALERIAKKRKGPLRFTARPLLVAGAGFEPATFGL